MIRKLLVVIISIVAAVVPTVLIITLLSMNAPKQERVEPVFEAPRVVVRTVETEPARLNVRTRGEVRPRTEIDLTTQVSGKIVYVTPAFETGGSFNKGDTLVQIEAADYELAVTRSEAAVAQARQVLAQEEAEAELARRDWEDLGGEGDASALTLRIPQLNKARADYAAAEADLRVAKLNLDRTKVVAPFKGRLREKRADLGQFVGTGTPLARIFATDVAQIRLPLTDDELALLNMPLAFVESDETPGAVVEFTSVLAGKLRAWTGRVVRTDGAIDAQTRQLYAIAQVDDPYGAAAQEAGAPLAIGLFVEAKINGEEIPEAILIPRTALRSSNRVFVAMEDDTLDIRTAEVVSIDEDTLLVQAGLQPGERLIVSVVRSPIQGMAVTPYDPDNPEPEETDETEEDADAAESEVASAADAGEGRL